MTKATRTSDWDITTHDEHWREYFGGIECLECEEKVPFGSKVYNEGGTNNYLCVKCF
jgi:hypothetical protein